MKKVCLDKNKGFSLAEVLTSLLVVSVILAATMPVITKRTATGTKYTPWIRSSNFADIYYCPSGNCNVGIGTNGASSVYYKLLLGNNTANGYDKSIVSFGVFGEGGTAPTNGAPGVAQTRFMWLPRYAAIRAGTVTGTQWDPGSIGNYSVAFGYNTTASGLYSTVSGGNTNTASALSTTVSGGANNTASDDFGVVGGGSNNINSGEYSTISGGQSNTINAGADSATISGGSGNTVIDGGGAIAGGQNNTCAGGSVIGGGNGNTINATAPYSVIGGGSSNTINATTGYATIGGGSGNAITGGRSTIGGGENNNAEGYAVFIGGGSANTAAADRSIVIGGQNNTSAGDYSLTGGRGMYVAGEATFAWGNVATALNAGTNPAVMDAANQFVVWGDGTQDVARMHVEGNINANGTVSSHSVALTSDIRLKNILGDYNKGLNEILQLKTKKFNYKNDKNKTLQVGIIAQETQSIFPEAVIKGQDGYYQIKQEPIFYAMVNSVKELKSENDELKDEVARLKKRVSKLEKIAGVEPIEDTETNIFVKLWNWLKSLFGLE